MSARLLLLLAPLVALQLYLQVMALRDLARQPRVAGNNNKWLWVAIIILGGLLGALVYFAVGRKEE